MNKFTFNVCGKVSHIETNACKLRVEELFDHAKLNCDYPEDVFDEICILLREENYTCEEAYVSYDFEFRRG